jgi:hypothetical protein
MENQNEIEVTTIDLPRVSRGERSEFTVTLEDVSILSDVYELGKTWAFSLTMADGQKVVSNVSRDDITKERMDSLRQHVKLLMGSEKIKGFEDLYPSH